jgi:hypothetical protein
MASPLTDKRREKSVPHRDEQEQAFKAPLFGVAPGDAERVAKDRRMTMFAAPAAKAQNSMASAATTGPAFQRAVRRPMLIRVRPVANDTSAVAGTRGVDTCGVSHGRRAPRNDKLTVILACRASDPNRCCELGLVKVIGDSAPVGAVNG